MAEVPRLRADEHNQMLFDQCACTKDTPPPAEVLYMTKT